MVGFDFFVKSMMPCLLELKVTPNFCFPNKIPDNLTATTLYVDFCSQRLQYRYYLTCVGDAMLGPQLLHITGNFLCGSVGQRVLSNRSITGLSEPLGPVGSSPCPSYSYSYQSTRGAHYPHHNYQLPSYPRIFRPSNGPAS